MGDLSHATSSARVPRILIADNNIATVKSLLGTFGDRRLDVDYDVCPSHDCAILKLFRSPPPYQLVISSARLATVDNFLLLKHNQNAQPFVPFVITGGAADTESSQRALEEGAFDLIPTPLEYEQTVHTIRLALWHNKLKILIASREKALEKYRQHMADYPGNSESDEAFQKALSVVQKTVSSPERTFQKIDESIVRLSDLATNVEYQARTRAYGRLNSLPR
jgi:DNA-binding NtrC family response regulator